VVAPYTAGLDFGTSGARIAVIDATEAVVIQHQIPYALPKQQESTQGEWTGLWRSALTTLLTQVSPEMRRQLVAIAINGTSATVLLCDAAGEPLTEPLLYNDDRGQVHREQAASLVPPGSPALSATSSLVKLLHWQATLSADTWQQTRYLMHQADWLAYQLHGRLGHSDYHNALKLGYDVGALRYPPALAKSNLAARLPQVQAPGTVFGRVSSAACDRYDLPPDCVVMAGTTDSIAAFFASGARSPGEAVTSLGSTLVIKLLSETRIDDTRYGIYSHRLGDLWLVGGASNTGGAVLKQFFSDRELRELSPQINRDRPSDLDYYPLSQPGERFPISDPKLPPRLTPRPEDPVQFLHGLLEGIARIEAQGYQRLQELGATPPTRIFSAGGGARNETWTALRRRHLNVPLEPAHSTDAAVGTAQLAWRGWRDRNRQEGAF